MAIEHPTGTVLLVDDDSSVLLVVTRLLEREGYTVFQARSGCEALDIWKARADEIDLLFTDLQLPDVDGPALAAILRSLRPDLKVLFTSGSGISAVEAMLNSAERGRFVPKPCRAGEMIQAVRDSLGD